MLNIDYPGTVYFYDGSERLDRSQIEYAIEKTKENYAHIGVRFPHLEFLAEGNFPQLRGIDMLVVFVDAKDQIEGSQWLEERNYGPLGIRVPFFDFLFQNLGMPYTQNEAIGKVSVVVEEDLRQLDSKCTEKVREEGYLRGLSFITTHEIGHGVGANDDYFRGMNSMLHMSKVQFMGSLTCEKEVIFEQVALDEIQCFSSHLPNIPDAQVGNIRLNYSTDLIKMRIACKQEQR